MVRDANAFWGSPVDTRFVVHGSNIELSIYLVERWIFHPEYIYRNGGLINPVGWAVSPLRRVAT